MLRPSDTKQADRGRLGVGLRRSETSPKTRTASIARCLDTKNQADRRSPGEFASGRTGRVQLPWLHWITPGFRRLFHLCESILVLPASEQPALLPVSSIQFVKWVP
jgi:hypothetical protein